MAQQVQAPPRRPLAGGIKSVIPDFVIEPRVSVAKASGGLVWEDGTCGFPSATRAGCYDDVTPPADKIGEGIEKYTTIGVPFAQYKGVECYLGDEDRTYLEQARTVLEAGDGLLIEAAIETWAAAGSTGTAATLLDALGDAETDAAGTYAGQPIILMSIIDATRLASSGALKRENGVLVTAALGTPVAASAAVADGTLTILGSTLVYVTPIVVGEGRDLGNNLTLAIAERVYAIGVDCGYSYQVTVTP